MSSVHVKSSLQFSEIIIEISPIILQTEQQSMKMLNLQLLDINK